MVGGRNLRDTSGVQFRFLDLVDTGKLKFNGVVANGAWQAAYFAVVLIAGEKYDMLGFGLSDKPPHGYSIHRQTELQESLLTALGVEEYDALVHDYGVSVGKLRLASAEFAFAGSQSVEGVTPLVGMLSALNHRLNDLNVTVISLI